MKPEQNLANPPTRSGRRRLRPLARDVIDGFMAVCYLALGFTGARGAGVRMVPYLQPTILRPGDAPIWEPVPGMGTEIYGGGWSRALPALAAVLLIGVVRRRPYLGASSLGVVMIAVGAEHDDWTPRYTAFITAVIALGYIASSRPRNVSVPCALIISLPWMGAVMTWAPGDTHLIYTAHLPVAILMSTVAWLAGDSTRERRAHRDRLRVEHTAQAVTTERLRIARELHDMIAHSIGIIAIQAGVGNRVIQTQPEEARKALLAIEETARDTLSGLRRTLTALRQTDPADKPLDPAPGLADLEKLAASTRHAGVRVELVKRGLPRPMPTDIDLAAYRIVQESVTNVVRHAGTHQCRVIVEYGDQELVVSVADDGHGVFAVPGGGFGLVGMRERVHLLHGEFSAGPRPGGGFLVTARIPVPGFGTTFAAADAKNAEKTADKAADKAAEKTPEKAPGKAAAGRTGGEAGRTPSQPEFGPRAASLPEAS